MRNPPPAHLPTRQQYDMLLLLVEIATLLGRDSVPLEIGSCVIDLLLPGTLAGKISALSRHGWMSLDATQENYLVHENAIPGSGTGLAGPSFRNVPDEAAANLVAHYRNKVRMFRAEHLLDPPESPAKRGRKPAATPVVPPSGGTPPAAVVAPAAAMPAPSPVPSIPETPPEQIPAPPQETTMSNETITADPHSWPKRDLDDGENRSVGPKKKTFEIDETDKAIMRACYGRDDLPALKLDIARFRRLTVMQVAGMEAMLTRRANAEAMALPPVEEVPAPSAPVAPTTPPVGTPAVVAEPPTVPSVATIPDPIPTLRLRKKEEIAEQIALYDHEIAELTLGRDRLQAIHDDYDNLVAALSVTTP